MLTRREFSAILLASSNLIADLRGDSSSEEAFKSPPDVARPYVLWMWMGSNVSKRGITRDLEAMKQAGIGGATIFSLSDTATPWAGMIRKSPTPDIVAFTDPWWTMVRHAATEARRLGLELLIHNCAGYESSGGPWIRPELSMQEVVWSEQTVTGPSRFKGVLARASVDPHPHAPFPQVYIPSLGKLGNPIVEARQTYLRDIAALAVPSGPVVVKDAIVDLSSMMSVDGAVEWDVPAGEWILYRFGHTTTGAMIQPASWEAMGLECDKMSAEAVTFHVEHVLSALRQNLGDLLGTGVTTLYFDSYEAGTPSWTPKMREEFQHRRGYDITPWLPVLADRIIGSEGETKRFIEDFRRTIHDLHRDCYWGTAAPMARAAGLKFAAEPYEGPWEISEVVQFLDVPTAEFWTTGNRYTPGSVDDVCKAADPVRQKVIAAEAFTSQPQFSHWTEHPAWLKPIGDAAFCAGINRLNLHHMVHQPWSDQYKPGNVMGQWGVHFGRNQTWWEPGKAWLEYVWRCQAVLQRGRFMESNSGDSFCYGPVDGSLELKWIRRRDGDTEIFFIANVGDTGGAADCAFAVSGKQPELWDPVWGSTRLLPEYKQDGSVTRVPLSFPPAGSFFVVFRKPAIGPASGGRNFPPLVARRDIVGPWTLTFNTDWGGPKSVVFETLQDWATHEQPGIKYYSGTAVYKKTIKLDAEDTRHRLYLDLGKVKHLARVVVNGRDLGVVWTAPWHIELTGAVHAGPNHLEIAVTNVWANRLIGDEQQPLDCEWTPSTEKTGAFLTEFPGWFLEGGKRPSSGRYTFTTWNYFGKDSPLEPSGLMGPVRLLVEG